MECEAFVGGDSFLRHKSRSFGRFKENGLGVPLYMDMCATMQTVGSTVKVIGGIG